MTIQTSPTERSGPEAPRHASRRGSVTILSIVITFVLVGVVGLGLDTALVMTARQQLQRTADAAALAAAAKVRNAGQTNFNLTRQAAIDTAAAMSNDIIRCGPSGIALEPNVANIDDIPNNLGDIVVGQWRFDPATHQFGFVRTDPGTGLPVPDAVKIRAKCASGSLNSSLDLLFSTIFGATSTSNVGRSSIAKLGRPDDPLILILHRTLPKSLRLDGGVIMDVLAGTVQVDSSNACAFNMNGQSGLMEAQRTRVVGGACLTSPSNLTGDLIEGSPYVPDPLLGLPQPSTVGMPIYPSITVAGTYNPGYYPDGINMNGGTAHLNPGVYVFGRNGQAGGIDLKGDAFLEGDGVLVFMESGAEIKTGGSGAGMRLTPALSGTYFGVTVFQARNSNKGSTITGGGVFDVKGTYYIPNGPLVMKGDVTRKVGRIIVDTQLVNGNATYIITGEDLPPPVGPQFVFLVN